MNRNNRQAGFTLIELLVSLTLLGLMVTLIGMALPLAITGAERTSVLSEEVSAVQTAQHLLRRQIGEMPVIVSQDGYDRQIVFSGKADTMRFVARPLAAQGGGGLKIVDLSVARTGAASRLIYSAGDDKRDLVTHAQGIRFSYYGPRRLTGIQEWQDSWKDSSRFPSLVRIQVQPRAGSLPWPDLVIALIAGPPPP